MGITEEGFGSVELSHFTSVENEDAVAVENGADAVCHCEHGALREGRPHRPLQRGVGGRIDVGRGFVHEHNPARRQQRPREVQQLPLARAEVRPAFGHFRAEAAAFAQRFPQSALR